MLIFHFGSREGLPVEAVRAVEAQQGALLQEPGADPRPGKDRVTRLGVSGGNYDSAAVNQRRFRQF
jgi:hypothetical protein